MIKVLITGANGQLGSALKSISGQYEDFISFTFLTAAQLDVTDESSVLDALKKNTYNYCINCAAYTNVDGAEENLPKAKAINSLGVKNLAIACRNRQTILIHISTDFVFSGKQNFPYTEEDRPEPLNVYGSSKLQGEQEIIKQVSDYYIIRTSWLYSEFGTNFMKSMLRLGPERDRLSVVFDQIGSPTYAVDLAEFMLQIVQKSDIPYGIYHYSNEGVASWYDFARAIFKETDIAIKLKPIRSSEYPLPAKRPSYSVLDKSKVKENFNIEIPQWQDSLKVALERNAANDNRP